MKRRHWVLLILIIAVALGSLREYLFINLNYQVDHVARSTPYSYAHSSFQAWVKGWSLTGLVRLKWALAVGFTGAMLGLTVLFAWIHGASRRRSWTIVVAYALVGTVALLLHAVAGSTGPLEVLSVKLLHLLQYPVLLFFVWAALQLGARAGGR